MAASALAVLLFPAAASAQVPEYQLKAEFLERFTRFIDWPGEATAGDPGAPFVIGVIGHNPFGSYLEALAGGGRTIKGRPVKIEALDDVEQAGRCQILYISGSEKRNLRAILAKTERKPVLTVGDTEGFAEKGVLVNFYAAQDRVSFEINDGAVRRSGLKFSSRLLKLARVVNLEGN